jgi:hypothetical protein
MQGRLKPAITHDGWDVVIARNLSPFGEARSDQGVRDRLIASVQRVREQRRRTTRTPARRRAGFLVDDPFATGGTASTRKA